MERINHEPTVDIDRTNDQDEKTNNPEVDREAEQILNEAIDSVSDIFREVDKIKANSSPKESQLANKLRKEASSALSTFYKKFRKIGLGLSILGGSYVGYAQYTKKDAVHYSDQQHLDRDHLTTAMSIVDTYLSSDVVDTYNKCVDFLQARKDGKMSPEEIAFKEQMAQRLLPFGYGFPIVEDLSRLHTINTGEAKYTKEALLNNKTSTSENMYNSESHAEVIADKRVSDRIRVDMFRKYLGLEQYFDTMKPAEYKPTQAKDATAKYYQFDSHGILKSIFDPKEVSSLDDREAVSAADFEGKDFDSLVGYVTKNSMVPDNSLTGQLGEYKAYVGFDKEKDEPYISYYDVWDMDPPQLEKLGITIDQFNFPYEIYGRIYQSDFDKYIQNQNK